MNLSRSVVWALIAMLAVSAVVRHARLAPLVVRDGPVTGDEAEVLLALRHVRAGQSPYHDYRQPPHALAMYMPLFYLVPGAVARLLATGPVATFSVGRAYVYAGWLATALAIVALARQAGGGRLAGAAAGLLWLAGTLAPEMAVVYRPDAVALALSLTAVWAYRRDRVAVATALLVAAFLHKHSAVAPLVVVLGAEIAAGRWRRGLAVLAGWTGAVAGVVLGGQMLTNGALLLNVFAALDTLARPGHVWMVLQLAVVSGLAALAGGVMACGGDRGGAGTKLLRAYFMVALVWAVASSAKFGSATNYYLEPAAVGCVLAGGLLERWRGATTRAPLVGLGVLLAVVANTLLSDLGPLRSRRPPPVERWAELAARLQQWPEPVLIEDGYLALRCRAEPVLLNASMFMELARAGRFDERAFRRRLADGAFGAVVTTDPVETRRGFRQFPADWLDVIGQRYRLVEQRPGFYLYAPRGSGR